MRDELRDTMANTLIESPRLAHAVAAGTTATGVGTFMDWIRQDIGFMAACAGLCLTVLLIILHASKGWFEIRKLRLDLIEAEEKAERRKVARPEGE